MRARRETASGQVTSPAVEPSAPPTRLRLRRTWPQRFVILGGMALVMVSLVSAWGIADSYNSAGEFVRYEAAEGLLTEQDESDPGGPRNILLVGTTENEGIDPDDPLLSGRPNTLLSDTIMLLRVEPNTSQAYVMSINRDLYIPNIAGYSGRINGAVSAGGIDLLLAVVGQYLDVPINDFAIVNFAGFRKLIDEVGGVPVYFEYPARDKGSFFEIDAGCHVLDGEQALNYVRSRKYEQNIDGDWTRDQGDDYIRAARQRDFLILMMERAIDKGARDPNKLRSMAQAVTDGGAIVLDNQMTLDDIIDISRAFGDFEPDNLQRSALPTNGAKRNGADILLLDEVEARPYLDIFRGLGDTRGNADVRFNIVEARAPEDREEDVATPREELADLGFDVVNPSTAKEADRTDRTTITYSPDQDGSALLLARNLATRPRFVPVSGIDKLTLTVGTDWTGVTLVPLPEEDFAGVLASAGGVTTTTAAPGATTTAAPGTATDDSTASGDGGVIGRVPDGVECT
jgi:LCP family protein required for cell wall assembly